MIMQKMQQKEQKEQQKNITLVGMLYAEEPQNAGREIPQVTLVRVWRQGKKVFTTYNTMTSAGCNGYYLGYNYFNPDSAKLTSTRGEKRVSKELDKMQKVFDCNLIYTGCNIRCMEDI